MNPFLPRTLPLPEECIDWGSLAPLLGQAARAIGTFNGHLRALVNPGILVSPLARREAVLSARIEGTVTTLDVILRYEGGAIKVEEQVDDIREIINYRKALLAASHALEERPLSRQLVREIHHVLLDSVRGEEKGRGAFREEQNYVASHGEISYVPPDLLHLADYLENFEEYLTYQERDPLVQTAIVHAQFELIHPFLDGNGRVGRMLIPLFLHSCGVLFAPSFYLSEYFDSHRDQYITALENLSTRDAWQEWIAFFLQAISEQAESNLQKAAGVHDLYERMKRKVDDMHTTFAVRVLDGLFYLGVFRSSQFIEYTDIPGDSAMRILRKLREDDVLKTIQEKSGRRPAVMAFAELINTVEGDEVV